MSDRMRRISHIHLIGIGGAGMGGKPQQGDYHCCESCDHMLSSYELRIAAGKHHDVGRIHGESG